MEVWGGNEATNSRFTRPGLDVWVWSQSHNCAEAGGSDLHLLSSCASGRITRMLVADICGCGTIFAEIAAQLRELMKRNVNRVRQSRAVSQMSQRLDDASRRGGFASALIGTYFASTRSLTLCNAGHPPPLLFRAQTREWSFLKQLPADAGPGETSLGVVSPAEYQQFTTQLEIGDMVLSYSDVLTECRNRRGQILGLGGLLKLVRSLDPERPAEISANLLHRMRSEHADNLAAEDATLLLCRATETRVAWRDSVLAPLRLLRPVTNTTSLGEP